MSEKLYWFMYAAQQHGEDLPDGAWWAHLESSVEAYNKQNKTNLDPYNTVISFLNELKKREPRPGKST